MHHVAMQKVEGQMKREASYEIFALPSPHKTDTTDGSVRPESIKSETKRADYEVVDTAAEAWRRLHHQYLPLMTRY